MVGRLLVGFLIDRIFAPYLTSFVFALVGLGCLALALGGWIMRWLLPLRWALRLVRRLTSSAITLRDISALANYGAIYGPQYSIFILGAGVSPILIGHMWDVTGNYDFALMLAAALMVPVMVISLTLPKFTHK